MYSMMMIGFSFQELEGQWKALREKIGRLWVRQ